MRAFGATLKRVLDGDLDTASDDEKRETVSRLIQTGCAAAMVATLQPLPLVDVALVTPIQIGMVQGIGRVYGYHLDTRSVLEVLNNVKTGLVTQHASLVAAKLIPAAGMVLGACVAHGLTYGVGVLADRYFRGGRTMIPSVMLETLNSAVSENVRRTCRSTWNDTRAFLLGRGGRSTARRLRDLERDRRQGRVTEEEAERAVDEIFHER